MMYGYRYGSAHLHSEQLTTQSLRVLQDDSVTLGGGADIGRSWRRAEGGWRMADGRREGMGGGHAGVSGFHSEKGTRILDQCDQGHQPSPSGHPRRQQVSTRHPPADVTSRTVSPPIVY
jgi:hypothetical protein